MNNFPEMNQLPPLEEIERKPSIEALQNLTTALKASSSSECLTRLRQAPSVSKLHRLARFLHLKHSPPTGAQSSPRDGSENLCEDFFSLGGCDAGRVPTRRVLFHETEIRPLEAVLRTRWDMLCTKCSSALVLVKAVRDIKAWRLAADACATPRHVAAEHPGHSNYQPRGGAAGA